IRKCSLSGTWIFSASVNELNNAPSWNSTPQRTSASRAVDVPKVSTFLPNTSTVPASGFFNPMLDVNNTDLPVPSPPTTPKTSLRFKSMFKPSWTTRAPNLFTNPRTRMAGISLVAVSAISDSYDREQDGESGIEHHDEEDRFDHGARREPPDASGI